MPPDLGVELSQPARHKTLASEPKDQRTKGPKDQRTKGPKDQENQREDKHCDWLHVSPSQGTTLCARKDALLNLTRSQTPSGRPNASLEGSAKEALQFRLAVLWRTARAWCLNKLIPVMNNPIVKTKSGQETKHPN